MTEFVLKLVKKKLGRNATAKFLEIFGDLEKTRPSYNNTPLLQHVIHFCSFLEGKTEIYVISAEFFRFAGLKSRFSSKSFKKISKQSDKIEKIDKKLFFSSVEKCVFLRCGQCLIQQNHGFPIVYHHFTRS